MNRPGIILSLMLFSFSVLYAQDGESVSTHIEFEKAAVREAVTSYFEGVNLPSPGMIKIFIPDGNTENTLIAEAVTGVLNRLGFSVYTISAGAATGDGLFIRVIDVNLNLVVGKPSHAKVVGRVFSGSFNLLIYRITEGKITWESAGTVDVSRSDTIPVEAITMLKKGAPSFTGTGDEQLYTGRSRVKFLTLAVVGVVTYLFYRVRS